jgi:hypothetical protein
MADQVTFMLRQIADEWAAAFEGPPESQMDALDYLAELDEQRDLAPMEFLIALSHMPSGLWSLVLFALWQYACSLNNRLTA